MRKKAQDPLELVPRSSSVVGRIPAACKCSPKPHCPYLYLAEIITVCDRGRGRVSKEWYGVWKVMGSEAHDKRIRPRVPEYGDYCGAQGLDLL